MPVYWPVSQRPSWVWFTKTLEGKTLALEPNQIKLCFQFICLRGSQYPPPPIWMVYFGYGLGIIWQWSPWSGCPFVSALCHSYKGFLPHRQHFSIAHLLPVCWAFGCFISLSPTLFYSTSSAYLPKHRLFHTFSATSWGFFPHRKPFSTAHLLHIYLTLGCFIPYQPLLETFSHTQTTLFYCTSATHLPNLRLFLSYLLCHSYRGFLSHTDYTFLHHTCYTSP